MGSRDPAKLVVLNSDSGEIVASYPAAAMIDDLAFDGERKRIYYAGTLFLDVFQEKDPDHFDLIAHMPTSVRAKTMQYPVERSQRREAWELFEAGDRIEVSRTFSTGASSSAATPPDRIWAIGFALPFRQYRMQIHALAQTVIEAAIPIDPTLANVGKNVATKLDHRSSR